ncbi:MAG: hypothetical protein AAB482_01945 [Patescibacteria group bacterium]
MPIFVKLSDIICSLVGGISIILLFSPYNQEALLENPAFFALFVSLVLKGVIAGSWIYMDQRKIFSTPKSEAFATALLYCQVPYYSNAYLQVRKSKLQQQAK